MENNRKFFLLTFDLEEFDLPMDYGRKIGHDEMYSISYQGTKKILRILNKFDVLATFFVTAKFALKYPDLISDIHKSGHEIASHGFSHSDYKLIDNLKNDISRSKEILEKIVKNRIIGFRAPRLRYTPLEILRGLRFEYDSSLHPTYISGMYNKMRNRFHEDNEILEIPISVTPILRLPFSWIWFRNLGLTYTKICTKLSLRKSPIVNIYFHPWEFVNIRKYNLPFYIIYKTGEEMEKKFQKYLDWCLSKNLKFVTVRDYISFTKNKSKLD